MATTKIISDVSVDGAVKIVPLTGSKALASSSDGTVVESSTTATELGYVHGVTSGIQGQIDAVAQSAAKGLKLVDLTTYSGNTDGEIVRHNGATTEHYVNGWDYKFQVIPSEYPSGVLSVRLNGAIANQVGNPVDAASLITTDRNYIKTTATPYLAGVSITWLQLSSSSVPAVGDGILFESGSSFKYGVIEEIEETSTRYNISFSCDGRTGLNDYLTKSDNQTTKYTFANNSGQTIVSRYAYINEASYIANASTTEDAVYFVVSGGKAYPILIEEEWMGSSSLLPAQSGWVQWDSQPSSVAEVSDLKTRMTAAETAIPGKQDVLTFDDAPKAGSGNVVKSGGVKAAIDSAPRFYIGTCSTAGNVAIKQVDIADFPTTLVNGVETPIVGSVIAVKFAYNDAVTTEQKKIKVNNTNAYGVWASAVEQTATAANSTVFGTAGRYIYYVFDGTYWSWVSQGVDANSTYTAGSGLKLSSNQFSLNVPRVTKTANSLPGVNTAIIEEYANGTNYNLPTNAFYHILTSEGNDNTYATQLALGMSGGSAYYRRFVAGTWSPWYHLVNPSVDSTPTASSTNPVQSGGTKTYVDEQVATKSSITIRQWVTE